MFAEAKYIQYSPTLYGGLWKGAAQFAFAVALSLSQPLLNVFLATDTQSSLQGTFVKYTPTAVQQQSPRTTWDYVHIVYSKPFASINANGPLSFGATQPSSTPTITFALALCMILALVGASLVLDNSPRASSSPHSSASGSSYKPRFASASPLARQVLMRSYRRARRAASFSSSSGASGSGSSNNNTGNTGRRRRASRNPNPAPAPSDGSSGSGQTPLPNARHFVSGAGAPPPPPPPGASSALASPFDIAQNFSSWLLVLVILFYPMAIFAMIRRKYPELLCSRSHQQYISRGEAIDADAKKAPSERSPLAHKTIKAMTTRVARVVTECTNTIPLPRPSARPRSALATPAAVPPPLQSLQVLCAALDAIAPTAHAVAGAHWPADLFAGGILSTLVKIYALGLGMVTAIAVPMLVILRSDEIPWTHLPSAIGQLWEIPEDCADEGAPPNNWIDLVFSTTSFNFRSESDEREVGSMKEAHTSSEERLPLAIATDDAQPVTSHHTLPATEIIAPRINLLRKAPRRKTVRDIIWDDTNADIPPANQPEATVQSQTASEGVNTEVNGPPEKMTADAALADTDNEDEVFVYPSKPQFTTSLTRRASVCTEIMQEEEPNFRNARARLQKAVVLGKRAASTPPAQALIVQEPPTIQEPSIVQDMRVEPEMENIGVAQSMWASALEPRQTTEPQQTPEPQQARAPQQPREPQQKTNNPVTGPVPRRSTRTPRSKHTRRSAPVPQAEAGSSRLHDTSTENNLMVSSSGLSASMWASAPPSEPAAPTPPPRVGRTPRGALSSTMRASAPEFKPRVTNSPPPPEVAPPGASASMWAPAPEPEPAIPSSSSPIEDTPSSCRPLRRVVSHGDLSQS
ncbi:hypothetical protein HYPSUDRAFT_1030473 [Hypholoma sublateritium FD-334 SS-4]|uniref:Uncharacterized protein n=1 Tax=Hypholoma sublateritium (strain FD-334 SS-4) TaxID=945553 RepID=A0A0D2PE01_HYPSF|nr:hypothetical protein HYPSUDRAFT_1030473 [Hypholoma sublateritium FD-334 SS-4]